jgi:hypothetical protein
MATPPIPPTAAAPAAQTSSSFKLPEAGTTEIDDKLAFEVELACYEQMHRLTARVAEQLNPHLEKAADKVGSAVAPAVEVFFLDDALRTALDLSSTIQIQLTNLRAAYTGARSVAQEGMRAANVVPSTASPRARSFSVLSSLSVPALVSDAAVALIGALRSDTRYFGRQVIVPEQAFALALAHEWGDSAQVRFHYPTLFVPPSTARDNTMREFVQAFDAVLEERKAASQAISTVLTTVTQLAPTAAAFAPAKASLDSARDQFQAAEAVFDDLSTKLTKADPKTGLTQLQLIERAIFVKKMADAAPGRTFYLFAQVVSAGGAFRVSRNFIRMLLWGDGLEHSGGCVVTFGLFDDKGELKASNTIGSRSPYVNSRNRITV